MPRDRRAPALYNPAAEAAKPQWCHTARALADGGSATVDGPPVAAEDGAAPPSRRERKVPSVYDPAAVAAQPQWSHAPPAPEPSGFQLPRRRWPFLSNVVKRPRARKKKTMQTKRPPQSPVKTFEPSDAELTTPLAAKKRRKVASPEEISSTAAAEGQFWKLVQPADAMVATGPAEAEAHVLTYLECFRRPVENDWDDEAPPVAAGSSPVAAAAAGAGAQNEEQMMRSLRRVVFAEVEHFRECCLGLRKFIKALSPRAFKGMREDKLAYDLAPIVRHLQERWNNGILLSMTEPAHVAREVESLADACKAAGFSRSLAFASKTLNMLGLPVPPFSESSAAFLRLPKGLSSYGRFLDAWTTEYAKVRREYEAAAARHIKGVKQGKFIVVSRSCMERRLGAEWFGIRGFDHFIKHVGGRTAAAAKPQ
jgi:hypothetical protein